LRYVLNIIDVCFRHPPIPKDEHQNPPKTPIDLICASKLIFGPYDGKGVRRVGARGLAHGLGPRARACPWGRDPLMGQTNPNLSP